MNYFSIGLKIKRIREGLNMSQAELAEKVGLQQSQISKIEKDHLELFSGLVVVNFTTDLVK